MWLKRKNITIIISYKNYLGSFHPFYGFHAFSSLDKKMRRMRNSDNIYIQNFEEYVCTDRWDTGYVYSIQINKMNFSYNLYSKYYYDKIKNKTEYCDWGLDEQYTFLFEQLKWIDKEYDQNRWLGRSQTINEFIQYLNRTCTCEPMDLHNQYQFSKECQFYIEKLEYLPESYRKYRSRFVSEDKHMGKKKLNEVFDELELSFEIESIRKKNVTYWVIVETSEK